MDFVHELHELKRCAVKILLIDNYDSFTWNLVQLLEQTGLCDITVLKNDQAGPQEALAYDRIILSPGPGLPDDAGITKEIIRHCAGRRSILGVCLGHQAIAEVFGAKLIPVGIIRHGYASPIRIQDNTDSLFRNIPDLFTAGRYHSWTVDPAGLPPTLKATALDEEGNIMAISHTSYDIKGVQFHPESYMSPQGALLLRNWLNFSKI